MYGSSDTARVTEQNTRPVLMEPSLRWIVSAPLYRKNSAIENWQPDRQNAGQPQKIKKTLYWLALSNESVEEERKRKGKGTDRRDFYLAGPVTLVCFGKWCGSTKTAGDWPFWPFWRVLRPDWRMFWLLLTSSPALISFHFPRRRYSH